LESCQSNFDHFSEDTFLNFFFLQTLYQTLIETPNSTNPFLAPFFKFDSHAVRLSCH